MHRVEADCKPYMCRNAMRPQHHIVCCLRGLHTPPNGWDDGEQAQRFFDDCLSEEGSWLDHTLIVSSFHTNVCNVSSHQRVNVLEDGGHMVGIA